MLKQMITVICNTNVGGPDGLKLIAGKVYELDDDPYVRILILSETVSLIDPPSLDPEFLEMHGYELCDGYSYPEKTVESVEEPVIKASKKKVSEESTSDEKDSDNEPKEENQVEGNNNDGTGDNDTDQEKDN